jgi:hypothetical protein
VEAIASAKASSSPVVDGSWELCFREANRSNARQADLIDLVAGARSCIRYEDLGELALESLIKVCPSDQIAERLQGDDITHVADFTSTFGRHYRPVIDRHSLAEEIHIIALEEARKQGSKEKQIEVLNELCRLAEANAKGGLARLHEANILGMLITPTDQRAVARLSDGDTNSIPLKQPIRYEHSRDQTLQLFEHLLPLCDEDSYKKPGNEAMRAAVYVLASDPKRSSVLWERGFDAMLLKLARKARPNRTRLPVGEWAKATLWVLAEPKFNQDEKLDPTRMDILKLLVDDENYKQILRSRR